MIKFSTFIVKLINFRSRLILKCIGATVTLFAFAFVGRAIYLSLDILHEQFRSNSFLLILGGSCVIYGLLIQICALAWHGLISLENNYSINITKSLSICGRTQIYKYLPTNVLHLLGRYSFYKKLGISNKALAFAQVGEVGVMILASSFVAFAFASEIFFHIMNFPVGKFIVYILLIFFAILFVFVAFASREKTKLYPAQLHCLLIAFSLYIIFFIGGGILVAGLCRSLSEAGAITNLIGVSAAAWLAGFLIPGAPGGLGVRESIMIAGLSAAGLPIATATSVALAYRIATTGGDFLVAAFFMVLKDRF